MEILRLNVCLLFRLKSFAKMLTVRFSIPWEKRNKEDPVPALQSLQSIYVLALIWFLISLYFSPHWRDFFLSPSFPGVNRTERHSIILQHVYGNCPRFSLREAWPFLWQINWVGRRIGIWPAATLDVVRTSWTSVLRILVTQTITKFPREEKLNQWGYEPHPKWAFVRNTKWPL